MTTARTTLESLKRRRPEWDPWLGVVEEILREADRSAWDAAVPSRDRTEAGASSPKAVPLLAEAAIAVQAGPVARLLERLIRIASQSGAPKMATLAAARNADLDVLALFAASLGQDGDRVAQAAAASGVDAEALQAVVALLSMPFLHACRRRWASVIPVSWVEGYCPVCGSWPAFAEVRGIERSRHFRCGRCGGAWHARPLYCSFCSASDHDALVSLVPEKPGSHASIDACRRCLGYVKTFTTLQGCPNSAVMIEDLASVDLDVAALEQGYARPAGAGYALDMTVTDAGAKRRLFAWNA